MIKDILLNSIYCKLIRVSLNLGHLNRILKQLFLIDNTLTFHIKMWIAIIYIQTLISIFDRYSKCHSHNYPKLIRICRPMSFLGIFHYLFFILLKINVDPINTLAIALKCIIMKGYFHKLICNIITCHSILYLNLK